MKQNYIDIIELSKYLSIKKSTIYDLVYKKSIPYIKIGRLLRFNRETIDQWIKQRTHIPFGLKICYNSATVEGEEARK
ncbi:MAG: excisionase family DNA-binding protein [Endomicrobiales bacterium]|nr:excisionase family DNA-binding protein [Endomicrobiales bacterium]